MQKVLSAIRNLAPSSSTHQTISGKSVAVTADDWAQKYKIKVVSFNNFPTAAGLASSASGYCCLGKPCFKKIGKHLSLFSYHKFHRKKKSVCSCSIDRSQRWYHAYCAPREWFGMPFSLRWFRQMECRIPGRRHRQQCGPSKQSKREKQKFSQVEL